MQNYEKNFEYKTYIVLTHVIAKYTSDCFFAPIIFSKYFVDDLKEVRLGTRISY